MCLLSCRAGAACARTYYFCVVRPKLGARPSLQEQMGALLKGVRIILQEKKAEQPNSELLELHLIVECSRNSAACYVGCRA